MKQNRLLKIFSLVLILTSLLSATAWAGIGAKSKGSWIDVGGRKATIEQAHQAGLGQDGYAAGEYTQQVKDPYVYAYTESCTSTNGAPHCEVKGCEANGEQGVLLQLLYAPQNTDVQGTGTHIEYTNNRELQGWNRGEVFCSTILKQPTDDTYQQISVTVTQADFQSLPLAPAVLNVPVNGHTLKNYNTNIWAQASAQLFNIEVNGAPVQVEATPISYVFEYGDGTRLETTNPGYELGEDEWDVETPTTHVYDDTGDYPVSVTTIYSGIYSVAGGPWLPVNGNAYATSDPQTVRVWKVRAGNVADSCVENPTAWGCTG